MKIKRLFTFLIPILLLVVSAGLGFIASAAPALPEYYYGTVVIGGSPAPVGTVIEATGTGVITGTFNPITITEAGKYGSSDPLANVPRLLVQGEVTEGETISFYVNGELADQTSLFTSGAVTELNLVVTTPNALTSVVEAMDANGISVIRVSIDSIVNLPSNDPLVMPGGLGGFTGQITMPNGGIEILGINGTAATGPISYNAGTGEFSVASLAAPMQPANTKVAEIVVRLTGNNVTPHTLQVAITSVTAAGNPSIVYSIASSGDFSLIRGDANGDQGPGIGDALFIAQYLVGQKTYSQLGGLVSASVSYDGTGGDKIGIGDALFIAQHLVGQRNAFFQN